MARGVHLPVNEIARAVSGAVASILSKNQGSPGPSTSDLEEFKPPLKMKKPEKCIRIRTSLLVNSTHCRAKASGLPSSFMKKKPAAYDRDIICLPSDHYSSHVIRIPWSRESLYESGLVGRIRLTSDVIFDEIRSVFKGPMGGNKNFKFNIFQGADGSSKTLVIPSVSCSYQWTVSGVAPCKGTTEGVCILT